MKHVIEIDSENRTIKWNGSIWDRDYDDFLNALCELVYEIISNEKNARMEV